MIIYFKVIIIIICKGMVFIDRINILIRHKKESLLIIFTIFFWIMFIGIFFDQLIKNEKLLDQIAKTVPVSGVITDISGQNQNDIEISSTKVDKLMENEYMTKPVCTSSAFSSFSKENCQKKQFDLFLKATNHLDSCLFLNQENIVFLEGYDESFLESDESVCMIEKSYCDAYGLKLNDEIRIPIYTQKYTHSIEGMFDFEYIYNNTVDLKIVGTYINNGLVDDQTQMVVPINWLRNVVEVSNPLMLNDFKEDIRQIGFSQVRAKTQSDVNGDYIIIDDSLFIDRANKVHSTIEFYELLQIPFFLLIILMINVIIFMIIRKKRVYMAISYSLGVSKYRLFYFQFIELFLLCMIAIGLDFLFLIVMTEIKIMDMFLLLCIVFIFMIIGILIGLSQVFRFHIVNILTHSD